MTGAAAQLSGHDLLRTFSVGPRIEDRSAALVDLIRRRELVKVAKTSEFEAGTAAVLMTAASGASDVDRLTAVATLGRIASSLKVRRVLVERGLADALRKPLPALERASAAGDRTYVAKACRLGQPSWCVPYLAEAAVAEESSEEVRTACVGSLVFLSGNLAATLDQLGSAIKSVRIDTKNPADSVGRRVRRLLAAIRTAISGEWLEPGPQAGQALTQLLDQAFRHTGPPKIAQVTREIAAEVAALVHELVRARFSVAADAETYQALALVQRWVGDDWEETARKSVPCGLVARDIVEALELLVRAGVTDDGLLRALEIASGSASSARELTEQLAEARPGLSEPVRDWLLRRPPRMKSAVAEESQWRIADEAIADLLLEGRRLSEANSAFMREVLPELQIVAPRLIGRLDFHSQLVAALLNAVEALARRRSLRIRGAVGEVVEYSPLEHEIVDGTQIGPRRVRLLRPIVEVIGAQGARRVVRKGVVEPEPLPKQS